MWIIPNNHPLSCRYAQESSDSNVRLKEFFEDSTSSLMWRSKPSSLKTWFVRWKRVHWLRHLFGRMLRRSLRTSFETELIGYLEDTLVRRSHLQDNDLEKMTLDTFGRILNESSKQLDLFAVSSKTLMITLRSDSLKFMIAYNEWVTTLRLEYTQRKKLAEYTRGNDSSSLLFTTPVSTDLDRNTRYMQGGTALSLQSKWLTPRVMDSPEEYETYKKRMQESGNPKNVGKKNAGNLTMQVNWMTPQQRDWKGENGFLDQENLPDQVKKWPTPTSSNGGANNETEAVTKRGHGTNLEGAMKWPTPRATANKDVNRPTHLTNSRPLSEVVNWPTSTFAGNNQGSLQEWGGSGNKLRNGQQDQDNSNTDGNIQELSRGRLNPKWVCQLMGITFEKTFYAHLATQLFPTVQKEQ